APMAVRGDAAATLAPVATAATAAATADGVGQSAGDPAWLAGLAPGAPAPCSGPPVRAGAPGRRLRRGEPMVWDTLTREFEAQLIRSALEMTRGRRIEAALKLGIGREKLNPNSPGS